MIKKYFFIVFILLFTIGCINHSRNINYTYTNKNTNNFKTSVYLSSYPSIEISNIDNLIKNQSNIVKIFNELSKIDKDEFTSSSEFKENINKELSKIKTNNGYLVFKSAESGAIPYLTFNADTYLSNIKLMSNYIPSLSKVYKFDKDYVFTVKENVSHSKKTGVNAFGVTNTYRLISGKSYDLYFNNIDFGLGSIDTKDINSNEARELKNNISIYYIVKLSPDVNKLTHISYDIDQPMIDTVVANNIERYIICVNLEAIVLCNKKTNKVVKVLYVN